jgi:endonuclease/exonuclease/phosphatase family metal-dependent hydrolase
VLDDTSLAVVNVHLAAGQEHVRARNADLATIVEHTGALGEPRTARRAGPGAYVGGGDGSMVLDHEVVFVHGDMNYRIALRRDAVLAALAAGDFEYLRAHDQLLREVRANRAFRLRAFREAPLAFAPTYKYDRRADTYDSSEKRRVPAWCDRVLWRGERVRVRSYGRHEVRASDHRPVSAAFDVGVKRVDADKRDDARRAVAALWRDAERRLLADARAALVACGELVEGGEEEQPAEWVIV